MESQDWSPNDDLAYIRELQERLEIIDMSIDAVQEVILQLLQEMRDYLCWKTGMTIEELSPLLDRLEEIAGPDLAPTLSLDEIADWAVTLRDVRSI